MTLPFPIFIVLPQPACLRVVPDDLVPAGQRGRGPSITFPWSAWPRTVRAQCGAIEVGCSMAAHRTGAC